MKNVEYYKPQDPSELQELMQAHKARAVLIAGGTNLIHQMRNGEKEPEVLVDISELADLTGIKTEDTYITIGAATSIAEIAASPVIGEHCPILAAAAKQLGNPLTRNRATIGGNLANASPCADTAPPLLALEAEIHITNAEGQARTVPADKFFMDYKWTHLEKGDVMTRIAVPKPNVAAKGGHTKLGLRKAAAICVASVALMLEKEGDAVQRARIAFGSVAPKPIRAYRLEQFIEGKSIDEKLLSDCEPLLQEEISPIGDIRGSESYRRFATASIFNRNMLQAWA
jgi:CO/xanthine dehydrogenase FAD-binding subunit